MDTDRLCTDKKKKAELEKHYPPVSEWRRSLRMCLMPQFRPRPGAMTFATVLSMLTDDTHDEDVTLMVTFLEICCTEVSLNFRRTKTYHMSRVSFYGEDQSEALKRHVVLSPMIPPVDRSHAFGWRLTFGVPSAPEIFQSAMLYGIIPAWVVLCHTTWLENRNENGLWKAVSTCGIPKSVRMKMSLTSSNDSRHCKRKSLKFWSKNAFQKKRRGPPTRSGRWERSFTERDLQIPHCLPFD